VVRCSHFIAANKENFMRAPQLSVLGLVVLLIGACATAPKSASGRSKLAMRADATLATMKDRNPNLQSQLNESIGYAVFPEIGKGGVGIGAAYGRGVLYENGRMVGFVELNQASIGAQLGGQTFAELILIRDHAALDRIKNGTFSLSGDVSAVALTSGAAASADFREGVAVYVLPRGGLMAELTISGQQINYQPMGT
jgi:lipid-binding SYLF domain-containing protein